MKNSGCHSNQSKKLLKILSSQTTDWIALLFYRYDPKIEVYRMPLKNQRTEGPESHTDGETLIFWD